MKFLFNNKKLKLGLTAIPLLILSFIFYYVYSGYERLSQPIESIEVVFDAATNIPVPVAYITDSAGVEPNFYEHFSVAKTNDSTFTLAFNRSVKLRQFRLYFHDSTKSATINAIRLLSKQNAFVMDLKKFDYSKNIRVTKQSTTKLSFSLSLGQDEAFFESPKFYYPTDYFSLAIAVGIIVFFSLLSIGFIISKELLPFKSLTFSEWGVLAFIISIFLPQRIFNIALVVSIVLVLRNFDIRYFLANKINLIFLTFFAVILVNFLFINPDFKFSSIEKYSLFLVLPIYVSCIRSDKPIHFFWVAALLIGGALLVVALIDFSIFRNLQILSFFNFTRSIHPIYYSYLLALSMVFLELNVHSKFRYVVHFALGVLLILSGSKLIIFLTLLWFLFYVRKSIAFVTVGAMLLALFVFAPTKERYESLFSVSDLKVISEKHIENPRDSRLNGLTLRLVLWQESIKFKKPTDILFGNGVSSNGKKRLVDNLAKRGLTDHVGYNSHNQYVTTLYKTGILGLMVLLILIVYCLRQSIVMQNRMLLFFTLLMSFAMLSESVFERVSCVAFFVIVILLTSKLGCRDAAQTTQA